MARRRRADNQRVNRRIAAALACLAALGIAVQTAAAQAAAAQEKSPLAVLPGDLRIEARDDGGYDLYVRKKAGIGSILLTESTKDPAMKADNYAYRAAEYNTVNGDEKRLLDGKSLPTSSGLYSLVSSTPKPDAALGEAFRILIPPVLVYGYPWSRSGTVAVGKGTYINIRAFAKPYADYSGPFLDNPYQISISTRPAAAAAVAPAEPQAAPPAPADGKTSSRIAALIPRSGRSLDLVICLDTTQSMEPYIEEVKKNLSPLVRERTAGFKSFRIGVVLYRDYWPDEYITKKMPFTSDISAFDKYIRGVTVFGGMDIPEAVYEAVYAAATEFDWKADARQVIVVGDAPPHLEPKGKVGFADAAAAAELLNIDIEALIEPADFPAGASAAALKAASDAGAAAPYAKVSRQVAFLVASGVRTRLAAIADDGAESERLSRELLGELAPDPLLEIKGARLAAAPAALADALAAAKSAGASHLVLSTTRRVPKSGNALCEIRTRLIEVPTGKVLASDVAFRTESSSGQRAEFLDGVRTR
jgi:hypothetical protein